MAEDILANVTGNITGNVTGPSGAEGWILAILSWVKSVVFNLIGAMQDIFAQNLVIGLIVVVLLFGLGIWLFVMLQNASWAFAVKFMVVLVIIILVVIVWVLQGQFDITGLFSGWLKGSIGVGNATNATGEIAKNVTGNGGINFWT
jgi:hypothetical protein